MKMNKNKFYLLSANAKILISILLMATIAIVYSFLRTGVNPREEPSAAVEHEENRHHHRGHESCSHDTKRTTKSERRKQRASHRKNPQLERAERKAALEREFIVLEQLLEVE
jgi:hypothetical protein